jgi:phosphoribosyl-ATP pyrophosphohydrolase/phosphoribosyl-AMP cyclohydrolase
MGNKDSTQERTTLLSQVFEVIRDRRDNPNRRFPTLASSFGWGWRVGGDNKILKKIGEESAEVFFFFFQFWLRRMTRGERF